MILTLAILTILIISLSGMSFELVYAQCMEEPCLPSEEIIQKLFENEEPYEIRNAFLYDYDEHNKLIEWTQVRGSGQIIDWEKSVYDNYNKLIEFKIYDQSTSSTSHSKFNYISGNNFLVRIETNPSNEIVSKVISLYNDSGKIIKKQFTDSRGIPTLTYLTDYNDDGIIIKEQKIITDGVPGISSIINYNDDGLKIEHRDYFGDENLLWEKYEYDKNKNLLRIDFMYSDEIIGFHSIFEYEDDQIISKTKFYSNSTNISGEVKYEYDKNNNLINEKTIDSGNLKWLYKFKYDENNNKIERIFIEYKNKLHIGTVRELTIWDYDVDGNEIEMKKFSKLGNLFLVTKSNYYDDGNMSQWIFFKIH